MSVINEIFDIQLLTGCQKDIRCGTTPSISFGDILYYRLARYEFMVCSLETNVEKLRDGET